MMSDPVAIVGVGMMTAVGLTAAETAAAVRARTSRFVESPIQDKKRQPYTIAEVPTDALSDVVIGSEHGITKLTPREQRLVQLAVPPIRECLAPLGGAAAPLSVCLALPETVTTRPLDRTAMLRSLAATMGQAIHAGRSDVSHVGRAGGLAAIGQAVLALQSAHSDLILAGGIDTYRDTYVLSALDAARRVKSESNWDGFIPGEGAAFVLLTRGSLAVRRGLQVLATISPVSFGFEPGHLHSKEIYRGEGLGTTISGLLASSGLTTPIAEVFSSMTGESHWPKEWGVAYLRNKDAFSADHGMHHPADCYGETGAASGPLLVGLATLGIQKSYRRAPALVYASSDRGPRAATIVNS
jgi:3-oxoacyl-[acyl-carrier-protein] synthase I